MSLCAVIPIKPLRRRKSRLSHVLSEEKREILNQYLLKSTLQCLSGIKKIENILVISYDPSALSLARKLGAKTVQENKKTNINLALRKATLAAIAINSSKLIILPADLPLLTDSDIRNMISKSGDPPEIVIAPDRKMSGTNALLVNPIGAIKYDFGEWSFRKHIEQAERKKINVKIYQCENLSFDLDLPEDLELLKSFISENREYENKILQEVIL